MKETNTTPMLPTDEASHIDPPVRALILEAQGGSQEACNALGQKYRPLLESSLSRFSTAEMTLQELADLEEEAERVFLNAIFSYDSEQNAVDFGLYAKICVQNGLISEWRRIKARRRVTPVSLGDVEMPVGDDPAVGVADDEQFRDLCCAVRELLSDFENAVWWQYVMGESVSGIAKSLSRDERSVHNAIYRIRRKLKERLFPNNA
jgi:DNA-directed RNA polymerase specialized sigma24 family protein